MYQITEELHSNFTPLSHNGLQCEKYSGKTGEILTPRALVHWTENRNELILHSVSKSATGTPTNSNINHDNAGFVGRWSENYATSYVLNLQSSCHRHTASPVHRSPLTDDFLKPLKALGNQAVGIQLSVCIFRKGPIVQSLVIGLIDDRKQNCQCT